MSNSGGPCVFLNETPMERGGAVGAKNAPVRKRPDAVGHFAEEAINDRLVNDRY